jgi:hypothetical protein
MKQLCLATLFAPHPDLSGDGEAVVSVTKKGKRVMPKKSAKNPSKTAAKKSAPKAKKPKRKTTKTAKNKVPKKKKKSRR